MNKYKELRKSKHLTQKEFAKILNVAQPTISKWELGKAIPDVQMLSTLAKYFNVTIDYLLDNKPITQKEQEEKPKWLIGENTITIIGRDGKVKTYTMSEEACKAFEDLLKATGNYVDPDVNI